MVSERELRLAWHGAGPVRAHAWWLYADGSTSGHISVVAPTSDEAVEEVRRAIHDRAAGTVYQRREAPSSLP